MAKAIIGENTLEQLHIVTNYKELEVELAKQKKSKKTQDFLRRNFWWTKRYWFIRQNRKRRNNAKRTRFK